MRPGERTKKAEALGLSCGDQELLPFVVPYISLTFRNVRYRFSDRSLLIVCAQLSVWTPWPDVAATG